MTNKILGRFLNALVIVVITTVKFMVAADADVMLGYAKWFRGCEIG